MFVTAHKITKLNCNLPRFGIFSLILSAFLAGNRHIAQDIITMLQAHKSGTNTEQSAER